MYLNGAYGGNGVQTPLHDGYPSELHHTAVGTTSLLHLPRERVEDIIERRSLPEMTGYTITDEAELFEELPETVEWGFVFNEQETIHGLESVGAPVKDTDGTILGTLGIIGPTSRMDDERLHDEPETVVRSVDNVEVNWTTLYHPRRPVGAALPVEGLWACVYPFRRVKRVSNRNSRDEENRSDRHVRSRVSPQPITTLEM